MSSWARISAWIFVCSLVGRGAAPGRVSQAWQSRSLRLADGQQRVDEQPLAAPISLTASDGTGLELVALEAQGVLEPPLAFTELHLTFENPEDRTREGRFRILLPPEASISRLAMKTGNHWQEGEVVERQAARRAYEDFLHRRQDPALLESQGGNELSARVFPIPPRGKKELIISYSHELRDGFTPYRIPLRGLPEIGGLSIRVFVDERVTGDSASSLGGATVSHDVVEVVKQRWTPDRDFEIPTRAFVGRLGLRHENLVMARIAPVAELEPDEVDSLFVLIDSSASRALGYSAQVRLTGDLMGALAAGAGPNTPVGVACFDQEVALIYAGEVGGFSAAVVERIRERRALGASDLHGALKWLAGHLKTAQKRYERLVIITDGVATAGAAEGDALLAAARALGDRGVARIDAVVTGGLRDEDLLRRVVTAGLARSGAVIDGDGSLGDTARRLTLATHSGMKVEVPGARWVWPERLDGIQAGDEVLVYADLPADTPFRILIDGADWTANRSRLVPVERGLLERAWVKARMRRIEHQRDTLAARDPDLRAALSLQIVDLSVRHRVLSTGTALLVLETEADYLRFGIDRNALTDILTVGATGLTVVNRSALAEIETATNRSDGAGDSFFQASKERAREERPRTNAPRVRATMRQAAVKDRFSRMFSSSGDMPGSPPDMEEGGTPAGNLSDVTGRTGAGPANAAIAGLRNRGGLFLGGGGSGGREIEGVATAGRIGGGGVNRGVFAPPRQRPDPEPIELSAPVVMGAVSPEVIRRVVAQNRNQIRYCYETELQRDQELRGKVGVKWTIAATGRVARVMITESTLDNSNVESCIQAKIRAWRFPAPGGGGTVEVNYPFVFRSAGDGGTSPNEAPAAEVSLPRVAERRARTAWERRQRAERAEEAEGTEEAKVSPYAGRFAAIKDLLAAGKRRNAYREAGAWHEESPGDVMALLALGDAGMAVGDNDTAARAYGSLIDLFPFRADMRRHAGERLERLNTRASLALALDTYAKAVEQRPDHPSSHRLYAFALLKAKRARQAFSALARGLKQTYPAGRFAGVHHILRDDLGMIAAAWLRQKPDQRERIDAAVSAFGVRIDTEPSLRFILYWETDANDVDLHVRDHRGGHAFYGHQRLANGVLYADVTTGYGPECFAIRGEKRAYPYRLQAHYFSRGPMGYGMGKLQIVDHDGSGGLRFDERPFVVMRDDAFVDLGRVTKL